MLRPDLNKWNLTADQLYLLANEADHDRTRERLLAIWRIARFRESASQLAVELQHDPKTVRMWVKLFNEGGPDALLFVHTGGRKPTISPAIEPAVVALVATSLPSDIGLVGAMWTIPILIVALLMLHQIRIGRTALRQALHRLGFSFQRRSNCWRGPIHTGARRSCLGCAACWRARVVAKSRCSSSTRRMCTKTSIAATAGHGAASPSIAAAAPPA